MQSSRIYIKITETIKYKDTTEALTFSNPQNQIQLEALKVLYRQRMDWKNPIEIKNQKLYNFVKQLYRENATIGLGGSTADAARKELASSHVSLELGHIEKSQNAITFLEKWLKNNQAASVNDRNIAENILLDCKDAIGEKLWYSNTNVPR